MADERSTLSPRAQEILRRADAQVESLRRSSALGEDGRTAAQTAAAKARALDGPPSPQQVMDRVQSGLDASRRHLDALAEALQALANQLGVSVDTSAPALTARPEDAAPGLAPESAPVTPPPPPTPVPAALAGRTHAPGSSGASGEVIPVAEAAAPEPADALEAQAQAAEPAPLPPPTAAQLDSARLVAIELAVGGETRDVVGTRLFEEHGIPDPTQILDDVFGPGSAASSRMPWGGR